MEKEHNLDLDKYLNSNTKKRKKLEKEKVKKKDKEKELPKYAESLKKDILDLRDSDALSSNKGWAFELITNIINKVSYLKSNLNNLTDEEIKELKKSLEDIIDIYKAKKLAIYICTAFVSIIFGLILAILSLFVFSELEAILYCLIITLYFMFNFYPDTKKEMTGEAFKILHENIKDIKELNKELAKRLKEQNTNEVKIAKVNQPEEVKKLETSKEYTLVNLINDTKRNIMMLNNNDEPEFNNRLALALTEFKNSLANSENMSHNMKKDMEYFASAKLTKELKSINEDVLKLYQETKQRMIDEALNKLINDYMSNIDESKDKIQDFIKLKDNLKTFLDNEDILSKMEIKERLAQCFYYTIKDFDKDEIKALLNLVEEDFYDALSLVGEEILNEREDNIEINSYYNKIKELKPKLSSYDYLQAIISILITSKSLKLKYRTNNEQVSKKLN